MLIIKENANQSPGLRGMSQGNKTLIFQFQSIISANVAAASIVFTAVIGAG